MCPQSVAAALDPLQQESAATEHIERLNENLPKFSGETQRTHYTEVGRHILIPACCVSRGLPAAVSMRPAAHSIFWHFVNNEQTYRDSGCCMHCCGSVCSLPLGKGAKRDYQPWSCLSVRPSVCMEKVCTHYKDLRDILGWEGFTNICRENSYLATVSSHGDLRRLR